jgi:dimeric dUTPase (all-alpha-NTP-PPase superfamily)
MATALASMINHNMTPPDASSLGNILSHLTGRAQKTQPLMKIQNPKLKHQLNPNNQATGSCGPLLFGGWPFLLNFELSPPSFLLPLKPGTGIVSLMENPDQLRELFRMQKALNARIGVHTDGMTEEEKTKWILNYTRAMSQEMAELTDSVPWKWWAKYQKFDEQNARVEVVDLFHFLISMAQVLGMSADDVFAAYVKKNEVNFKRQESGYVQKDHDDSKHI